MVSSILFLDYWFYGWVMMVILVGICYVVFEMLFLNYFYLFLFNNCLGFVLLLGGWGSGVFVYFDLWGFIWFFFVLLFYIIYL